MNSTISKATEWLKQEQNETHKHAITKLIERRDPELKELFDTRLQFGTAGLRGEMGPGPNRMNACVVARTSKAIAEYVLNQHSHNPSVTIGYDARNNSNSFAQIAAGVFAACGFKVHLFEEIVPTPLLSYAVIKLKSDVGVMITASHNPPKDNGYKVYWSNGAQIIPPHDKGISSVLDTLPLMPIECNRESNRINIIPNEVGEAYLQAVTGLRVHSKSGANVVYTPLHGVGGKWVEEVLKRADHNMQFVPKQAEPDGNFPYAPFPNPEEKGSMDMAYDLVLKSNADIAIANDPDADRLAVVVNHHGKLFKLTGDQVGLILAEDLLTHGKWGQRPMVATTIVSSSQLKQIAISHQADYAETLTGFKWIANKAIEHDENIGRFVLGFEEALGYSVGDVARDKDGVSAALLICDLSAFLRAKGMTLVDYLNEVRKKYGVVCSRQMSIKKPGSEGKKEIEQIMADLRDDPPTQFAGTRVQTIWDMLYSTAYNCDKNETATIDLPKSNVLAFDSSNERIIIRPSGTEPKIKFYFEVKTSPENNTRIEDSLNACEKRIDQLVKFVQSCIIQGE